MGEASGHRSMLSFTLKLPEPCEVPFTTKYVCRSMGSPLAVALIANLTRQGQQQLYYPLSARVLGRWVCGRKPDESVFNYP